MSKTVAVFFGGRSNEREISVITGMYAVNLLRGEYRVLPIFLPVGGGMALAEGVREVSAFRPEYENDFPVVQLTEGGLQFIKKPKKKIKIDIALNCCHGGMGEDGTLSALLSWYQIPSASPNMQISALFMDKSLGKIFARGLNIPVLPSVTLYNEEGAEEKIQEIGYPVIVKPSKCGSSVGITVAKNAEELESALALAFSLDEGVLIEKYLPDKRDCNLAVYRKDGALCFSPVEEVVSANDILTFDEKYLATGEKKSLLPAPIPPEVEEEMQRYLSAIYTAAGDGGVVRADFLLSGGSVYLNELNTVPGSLSCYLFGEGLASAKRFLISLLNEASLPQSKPLITAGILSSGIFYGTKACKRRENPL